MPLAARCLELLDSLQHPDGGWGYTSLGPVHTEPTCLALMALEHDPERFKQTSARACELLCSWQGADGAWRLGDADDGAVWPTALALFTIQRTQHLKSEAQSGSASDSRMRAFKLGLAWLLNLQGRKVQIDDFAAYRRDFEIDPTLTGWPWVQGTSAWVEPTAWACLALRHGGYADHPRVEEGLRFLLDRAMDDGGVNAGNRRVFGRATQPVPAVTALLLLAFAGCPDHPRLEAARQYLYCAFPNIDDLETLCWIRLALHSTLGTPGWALEQLASQIREAYARRQNCQLFSPSPVREALTALALSAEDANPFRWLSPDGGVATRVKDLARTDKSASLFDGLAKHVRLRFGAATAYVMHMLRPPPLESAVHIAAVSDYEVDLASVLREQYGAFREKVPLHGKRVVLKPNMVEYHRDKVINTDPRVIAAVIELCRQEGAAEVIVAEGPGHWRNSEYLVTASGLGDVLRHYKTPFVDLNHDELTKLPNMGRLTGLAHLYFAPTIATAEVVVSLPKLKTHHWAAVTLGLKNMFGALPGICYGWPKNVLHWRGIDNSIVDIALTRAPDLVIVDGIIGMEGDGPLNGTPKAIGVLVMGADPLAVDATCCLLMQMDPLKVGHLALAGQKKVGQIDAAQIKQLGETITARSQPFETIAQFAAAHGVERQAAVIGAE